MGSFVHPHARVFTQRHVANACARCIRAADVANRLGFCSGKQQRRSTKEMATCRVRCRRPHAYVYRCTHCAKDRERDECRGSAQTAVVVSCDRALGFTCSRSLSCRETGLQLVVALCLVGRAWLIESKVVITKRQKYQTCDPESFWRLRKARAREKFSLP